MKLAIVKYNAGNIRSVINALLRLGVEAEITDDPQTLRSADKVIFPGQGEAHSAMDYLTSHGLDKVIRSLNQPVLGICIGQQLLCKHSEEGNVNCIGIFDSNVVKFQPNHHQEKVPQMGWNAIHNLNSPLFTGIDENSYVYFVHSFYVPLSQYTIATTDYILPYSSAIHRDNFFATQFHPEKSGSIGEQILKNFLTL